MHYPGSVVSPTELMGEFALQPPFAMWVRLNAVRRILQTLDSKIGPLSRLGGAQGIETSQMGSKEVRELPERVHSAEIFAALATHPSKASRLGLACEHQDNDSVDQAGGWDRQNHGCHEGVGAPLLLPPVGLRLLPGDQGKKAQRDEGGRVRQHIGPRNGRPERGGVHDVVLEVGQLGVEEPVDLIADDGGKRYGGVLKCADQSIAESFAARLRQLNDHQIRDQLQHGHGNASNDVLAEVEVLAPHHAKGREEGWDCVGHGDSDDGDADGLSPADLQEEHLVHPGCCHHDGQPSHAKHLLLQDFHVCPLAPNHWSGGRRLGDKKLDEESEKEKARKSLLLNELPGRLYMGTARGALPRLRGLMDAKHGNWDDEDDQDQANAHQAAEGQPPVECSQICLAIHEDAKEQRRRQSSRRACHRHLRLDVPTAFDRLTLGVFQQQAFTSHAPQLHTCGQHEQRENVPVLLLVNVRIARRHVPVVITIRVLAVEWGGLWLQTHGEERNACNGPGHQQPRLPVLATNGEAVGHHTER